MVGIIDYGVCNIGAIWNMLRKIGINDVKVIHRGNEMRDIDHLILPGVGSFDSGMESLEQLGLVEGIRLYWKTERPLLGICLGMQLLFDYSEEGECRGLGFIKGNVYRFNNIGLNIPHMGWNTISLSEDMKEIFYKENARYYFVHSYYGNNRIWNKISFCCKKG